jgi:hypothetical protein
VWYVEERLYRLAGRGGKEDTLLHKMAKDCWQKIAEIMKLMDEEKYMVNTGNRMFRRIRQ